MPDISSEVILLYAYGNVNVLPSVIMISLFKLKQKSHLDSRGDTIVEVLIAIAIVSVILLGAYNVSTKSLTSVRDAQEHNQALQIAQGQLEILDSMNGLDLVNNDCFDGSGNIQAKPAGGGNCFFNAKNKNNCTTVTEPYCYQVRITEPVPHTYHVEVFWDKLGGGGNVVSMYYRLPLSTLTSASGVADIGGICDAFPAICSGPPPPPPPPGSVLTPICPPSGVNNNTCYGWYMDVYNTSSVIQNPLVVGCEWNWGDGSPNTVDVACLHGQAPPRHWYNTTNTYINAPPYANADAWMVDHPWPTACLVGDIYAPYTITLTVHLSNGLNPVKTFNDYRLPWCDVAWL